MDAINIVLTFSCVILEACSIHVKFMPAWFCEVPEVRGSHAPVKSNDEAAEVAKSWAINSASDACALNLGGHEFEGREIAVSNAE